MLPVQTFYPYNEVLQKRISYYYFIKTDSPEFESSYYSFPNTVHSLNIHKHARSIIQNNTVLTENFHDNKYMITVQGKYDQPLLVQLKGVLNKITIVFKPLGLNAFIRKSFSEVANQPTQLFNEWNNEKGYSLFLDAFFNASDNQEQIQILESFLLSIFAPVKECELLEKGIELLSDFDEDLSIKDISNHLGMNERTFNRLFEKLVGISPVGFKKIARFRHSLMNKLFHDKFKRLTEIGYASNFYDQSYFIKVYNKLAGTNPKNFFNSIDKLADDNLIFRFINSKAQALS